MRNLIVIWFMRLVLLPLLRLTTWAGGERAWRLWEWLTAVLAGWVGRLARWIRPSSHLPLAGMMQLIDGADGMLGIRGNWQTDGQQCAVKHIARCPLASDLQAVPDFCTRLGVIMGQAAFRAYAPDVPFTYTIPLTLSQGHSCCEYHLLLASDEQAV